MYMKIFGAEVVRRCADRSGSEAVTSKASLGSDEKMRGEALRLRTVLFSNYLLDVI